MVTAIIKRLLLVFVGIISVSGIVLSQTSTLDQYFAELEKYKKANDKNQIIYYLNKIALYYVESKTPEKSIEYFLQSAEKNDEIGNLAGEKTCYSQIANVYSDMNQPEKAMEYANKSLDIRRKTKNKKEIAIGLVDIASILEIQGKPQESNNKLEEALALAGEVDDKMTQRNCYGLLAQNYKRLGRPDKSEECFEKYYALRKYLQENDFKQREVETNSRILRITERAEKEVKEKESEIATKNLKLKHTTDSLSKLEIESMERLKEIKELSKDKAVQELILQKRTNELRSTRIKQYFIFAILILVLGMVFFVYRGYRDKKKAFAHLEVKNNEILRRNHEIANQRDEIEKKSLELQNAIGQIEKINLDIHNSINYAQRIQKAMLPSQESFRTMLPESFILLKPRNVVSGDFYWFKEVESMAKITRYVIHNPNANIEEIDEKGRNIVVAAVDCTGHGVPGAFMSMIGFNLLNEITANGVNKAYTVLNNLHKSVRSALRQDTTDNRDGMDMALCVIDLDDNVINFAGAKNPLVTIYNGQLTCYKGDKEPIGGLQREEKRKFTNQVIQIEGPTWCYVFSDGYLDQFGGPSGRKFMKERFFNLLLEIHTKPADEQRAILSQTIEEWKGDKYHQVDDILVMGFKVDKTEKSQEQRKKKRRGSRGTLDPHDNSDLVDNKASNDENTTPQPVLDEIKNKEKI